MSQSMCLVPTAHLCCAFVVIFALLGCGSGNLNHEQARPQDINEESLKKEHEALGIIGGVTMTSTSSLLKYMRAVRHRFSVPVSNARLVSSEGGDRFCSGVAVSKNITLTAAHCVELSNNVGELVHAAFNPNTTLPFKLANRRLFFGHLSASHELPLFSPSNNQFTIQPSYLNVTTSTFVSLGSSNRSADIGFLYDFSVRSAPPVVPLCTEAPAVGQTITVTGIKVVYDPTWLGYSLKWGEYQARVTDVYDRPTTILNLSSSKPAVWSLTSPTFSKSTLTTSMEFISEAVDSANNCAEGGDSGGGVFLTRADGTVCLLGINSARGASVNLGTKVQCTPTLHRRVLPQMLDSLPLESQTGPVEVLNVNSYDGPRRADEFNIRFTSYPPGIFVPLP